MFLNVSCGYISTILIGKPFMMRVLTSGNKIDYKCIDFPMMDNIFFNLWNKIGSVGMKIFLFNFNGNKNYRVGKKYRVGRVSGNTVIFLWPKYSLK